MVRPSWRRPRATRKDRVIACCLAILLCASVAESAPATASTADIIAAILVLTVGVDLITGVLTGLFHRIPFPRNKAHTRKRPRA